MAGGSRTLKLTILGDVDNLNKSLKAATGDVETFGDKMGKVGKMVGAAFAAAAAAAGAYAIKIGVDGVKAAIEDEKSQTQLALALENATGATRGQIAATEEYILQTSLATGVTDDNLRPALARLTRSTGDVTNAQSLLKTALDISTATGKPLEAVANALGKAYEGNAASLGKLGIGLSATELKSMSFAQVQERLNETFGGAAAANAETYAGKIARVQVAFSEAKETIGYALLPILETLMNFINTQALPIINKFADAFSLGDGGLGGYITMIGNLIKVVFTPILNGLFKAFGYIRDAIGDNMDAFMTFGKYITTYLAPVIGTVLGGALQVVGKIAAGVIDVFADVLRGLNSLIGFAISAINAVISAYNKIPFFKNIPLLGTPNLSLPSISSSNISAPAIPAMPSFNVPEVATGGASGAAVGNGKVIAGSSTGGGAAYEAPVNPMAGTYYGSTGRDAPIINLTVNGAVDGESVARQIVEILNNSSARGSLGAAAFA